MFCRRWNSQFANAVLSRVSSCKEHLSEKEAAHDPAGHDHDDGNSRGRYLNFQRLFSQKGEQMRNRLGIGLIALVFLLAMPLLAQNTGIISGRVTDPSGAVVANAQRSEERR